jgi:hypothetical protein
MGRVGIYLKDKIEREVRDIVQQDLQNGATAGEANMSATCNELIRLGLLVYKRDGEDGNHFDIEGYRRDLIRKAAGSREGTVLIATLLAEMYLKMTGKDGEGRLEDTLDMILNGINTAEDEAETRHFINEKNKSTSRKPRLESITGMTFHPTEGHFSPPLLFFSSETPRTPYKEL